MKRFVFYVPVIEKELLEFLKTLVNDNKLSETTLRVMKFIMEHGFEELQNLDALKKDKIRADIEYKKVSTEYIRAKLKYIYNFETEPSRAGSHAIKEKISKAVESGQMQAAQTFSFYDEKNDRIQCPSCGILFTWQSDEEKKIRKDQFIDHFIQVHRMLTKPEEEELYKI